MLSPIPGHRGIEVGLRIGAVLGTHVTDHRRAARAEIASRACIEALRRLKTGEAGAGFRLETLGIGLIDQHWPRINPAAGFENQTGCKDVVPCSADIPTV